MSGVSDTLAASGAGLQPSNERELANSGSEDPDDPKRKAKRRTKSGCLTCRTRRVKCDEGKPICQNCAKGKRNCEYASSRVVFKQPMGTDGDRFAGRSGSYHQGMLGQRGRSGVGSSLPVLAPKPPGWNIEQGAQVTTPGYHFPQQRQSGEPSSRMPPASRMTHEYLPQQHAVMQMGQFSNPLLGTSSSSTGLLTPLSNYSSHGHGQGDYLQPVSTRNPVHQRFALEAEDEDNIYEFNEEDNLVESDDDMLDPEDEPAPVKNLLSRAWHTAGTGKILDAFLENKALFSYMEHPNQSELRDNGLRAVVCYFIKVTSPTISMYEREPYELTRTSQSKDGLATGGNDLWCRTIPLMAFHSSGLLQAILALASLQLANLQNAPPTAAMKHYHLAIVRVKHNVMSSLRRTRFATLATLLLLAFFEVWAADHSKWCRHLFGASILLKEIPLLQMSKKCLPAKRDRDEKDTTVIPGPFGHGDTNLNYELLGVISGLPVAAEDYGLGRGQPPEAPHLPVTERDIKNYENHADLFWWFCKMDVYQSFLGGTKLFMGYNKWLQCPPRTPMSKPKQVYGTYDHVVLLLGRLANFVTKDQARKKKEKMNQPPRPNNDSPPLFPGIMPTQGRVQPTAGFSPTTSPKSDATEEAEGTLEGAIKEWDEIRRAFAIVKTCFSPEFQPLSNEYADRRDSPFGAVVQYRSYAVAGVWMNYYMGLIHLHRSHPKMPYAALQAVGMCAKDTAVYANQIGRIACGLLPDTTNMLDANPLGAAALIECSFCLFVAGVQYQDSAQRQWLIQRLHDTARLTGWMTARQIAEGCESAWVKAAQFGRGQPYTSRFNPQSNTISVWQSPRRLDRMMQQSDTSDTTERRIVLASHQRAHYALGLLSVEEDLGLLTLEDE